jgi:hypothetical protein
LVIFSAFYGMTSRCAAHQKWLSPNFFVSEKGPVWLSFDVTWSDQPFAAEAGVGERPLWVVEPSGKRAAPPHVFVGKTKSVAEVELTQPGTYRLESVDPVSYWTRIEEDGKERWIAKPKNEVTGAKITRSDLYWSKAVAYVTLGEPTEIPPPDDAEPLAIRTDSHPNQIRAGQPLELRVLSYGKPLGKAKIKVFSPDSAGHDPEQEIACDENGIAAFEAGSPGRYLLSCESEREVADDPKADIHSFNFYLTLQVRPKSE